MLVPSDPSTNIVVTSHTFGSQTSLYHHYPEALHSAKGLNMGASTVSIVLGVCSSIPRGSMAVLFCGLSLGSYKVIPKRDYHGASGYKGILFKQPQGKNEKGKYSDSQNYC